jgi:hypothetical protein
MFLGVKGGRSARKADNLTATCVPICGILNVSRPCRPLAGRILPLIRPLNLPSRVDLSTMENNRHLLAECLENVEASTSHKPVGFHGLLRGEFCLLFVRLT